MRVAVEFAIGTVLALWAVLSCLPDSPGTGVRPDGSVRQRIDRHNASLNPTDRKVKYEKMARSAFVFFRGTNHLFWEDMAGRPERSPFGGPRTRIWLHGDLHVENYGSFTDRSGTLVYDFNDFDDSIVADYRYDVWRMATSIELISRQHPEVTPEDRRRIVHAFASSYLSTMSSFRGNDSEREYRVTLENAYGRLDEFLEDVLRKEGRAKMLESYTRRPPARFDVSDERLGAVSPTRRGEVVAAVARYAARRGDRDVPPSFFGVKDVAARLFAGTGSLGTKRYYVLIEGETAADDDDRILDIKQQGKPSAYRFLTAEERRLYDERFANDALRQCVAYRALCLNVDPLLGWTRIGDEYFSVRERSPYKETLDVEDLDSTTRLRKLSEQWGSIAAANHARADRDFDPEHFAYSFDDELCELIGERSDAFARSVAEIASTHADQVERDYASWLRER